jgi:hypothetical protein
MTVTGWNLCEFYVGRCTMPVLYLIHAMFDTATDVTSISNHAPANSSSQN